MGIVSLRLLLTVSPGWALTETQSQTPAPELCAAKFRPSGMVCLCAHASGFLVRLPVEPELRQKEEVAFALLDLVSFSIHLLLLSDINCGMRKPKPEKISLPGKLCFRC